MSWTMFSEFYDQIASLERHVADALLTLSVIAELLVVVIQL